MYHPWNAPLFLVLLACVLLARGAWIHFRGRYRFCQWLLLLGDVLLTRFLWRLSIPRRLPVGPREGAVLIANHRSSVDPFFFQIIAGRPVHWMVAREYCEHPKFRWFLKQTEAIPVGRGGIDPSATRAAIRFLQSGELVGMFPEGRLNTGDDLMLPVRPGAIVVALKARVPVIPCHIEGSPYGGTAASPIWTPARVRVRIGAPISLAEYHGREGDHEAVREALRLCVRRIAELAGRDDFEPQLAGRNWKTNGS
jgi:1-acyl-sn-glycerol-3-phosphate acyltransferase